MVINPNNPPVTLTPTMSNQMSGILFIVGGLLVMNNSKVIGIPLVGFGIFQLLGGAHV